MQGVAGLVCRKRLLERRNGDGTESAHAAAASSAQPLQASSHTAQSYTQPDSSVAVVSAHASSHHSPRERFDAITERLADLQLSDGVRQRRPNRPDRDVHETVYSRDRHHHADEPDSHRD